MDAFLNECSWIAITLVVGQEAWGWARRMPKGPVSDSQTYSVSGVVEKVFEAHRAKFSESERFTELGTQIFQRVSLEFAEVTMETYLGIDVAGSSMHHSFNESEPMNAQACVMAIDNALKKSFEGVFGPFEGLRGNDARYLARAQREWRWVKDASLAWEKKELADVASGGCPSRPDPTL